MKAAEEHGGHMSGHGGHRRVVLSLGGQYLGLRLAADMATAIAASVPWLVILYFALSERIESIATHGGHQKRRTPRIHALRNLGV